MSNPRQRKSMSLRAAISLSAFVMAPALFAQGVTVSFAPYIQLGDNGPFGPTDQIVVAWQTNESTPNPNNYRVDFGVTTAYGSSIVPTGRVVDNYLAADAALPSIPTAYGAHTDYVAVLAGLNYGTTYFYRVSGPGLPGNGFTAPFNTRKRSSVFSFAVEGDEGYFPFVPNASTIVNYEARIAHLIKNVDSLSIAGLPARPAADIILNTGDNIYNTGSEDNYRDFFFPVLNNDVDSNETGAPILRSTPYFVVDGNHDVGSTGVSANLLADNAAPRFSGNTGGGDAVAFYNNLYYPLNGPAGFDIQNTLKSRLFRRERILFFVSGKQLLVAAGDSSLPLVDNCEHGSGSETADRPHEQLFVRLRQRALSVSGRQSSFIQWESSGRFGINSSTAAGVFGIPDRAAPMGDQRLGFHQAALEGGRVSPAGFLVR